MRINYCLLAAIINKNEKPSNCYDNSIDHAEEERNIVGKAKKTS